ncbi:hypothetical protein AB0M43_36240 [Longispora sp. NPDC051575]|uniref:hypothetical protein n=1 Tax=Longispora sp. NPDC051575 TaxID=3154943 RepID=UPI00342E37B5
MTTPPVLPVPGRLLLDQIAWEYPSPCAAGSGLARLRIWQTTTPSPGHLALVTDSGIGASITNSIAEIWHTLRNALGAPLWLLEHWPADASEPEHLEQVAVTGLRPSWWRAWPTSTDNPRHELLQVWMIVHGRDLLAASGHPTADFPWGPHCAHPECGPTCQRATPAPGSCRARTLGCPLCPMPDGHQ